MARRRTTSPPLATVGLLLVLLLLASAAGSSHEANPSSGGGSRVAAEDDDSSSGGSESREEGPTGRNHHHRATAATTTDDVDDDEYLIGTGIYDMTGPAAQVNFMGYAQGKQNGHGIHMRLRSRAYIVARAARSRAGTRADDADADADGDADTSTGASSASAWREQRLRRGGRRGEEEADRSSMDVADADVVDDADYADPEDAICFVSIDAGMGSDLLTSRVVRRLEELLPPGVGGGGGATKKKPLCHLDNLSISGTHTHSGPGGFLQYTLYQITSLGYSSEVMDTFVESISQSVLRAYNNIKRGRVTAYDGGGGKMLLEGANINRSPTSYLLNPREERERYAEEGDTDKSMLLLRFTETETATGDGDESDGRSRIGSVKGDGGGGDKDVGILTWFAVHGTSMNSSNLLISGDNKGYASYLMERHYNGNSTLPGNGDFVAAFASTNLGDVSPNTAGPRCIDTGLPCDAVTSTCDGKNELCIASGPGRDMFESTEIIGRKQYQHALDMLRADFDDDDNGNNASSTVRPLRGEISYRHSFVDMANLTVRLPNGTTTRTCPAALGYSFAAGTTDGPGALDFRQNTTTSNPFWDMVGGFLSKPTQEQVECQSPKPILLNTGEATLPYRWDPSVVPISIFRVGDLLILNVPCEFTTMAGRRLRSAVSELASSHPNGMKEPIVTIAGLSNSYTHYVTTPEEYGGQRYEAASTLYGPHTLDGYVQEFERLTNDLFDGVKPSDTDGPPPDLSGRQISLIPPVAMDLVPFGKHFGDVTRDVDASTPHRVGDTVSVTFRSANPRNDQRIGGTFLTVDRLEHDGKATEDETWTTRYVDGDWCTRFIWEDGHYLGISHAVITWEIPDDVEGGTYRICHQGTRKHVINMSSWIASHLPRLLNWNGDGVRGLLMGLVGRLLRRTSFFLPHVDLIVGALDGGPVRSKLMDFEGCSSTFEVVNTRGPGPGPGRV